MDDNELLHEIQTGNAILSSDREETSFENRHSNTRATGTGRGHFVAPLIGLRIESIDP